MCVDDGEPCFSIATSPESATSCTPITPARDTLDIWPALPLIVAALACNMGDMGESSGTDNIIAALGQSNRVCEVFLWNLARSQLEAVLATMQVPFPELTEMRLWSHDKRPPVILEYFLRGSSPRLQTFDLDGISFPGVQKLLLSTTQLVYLWLFNISHSGYISPEAMVAVLSALSSNLRTLYLGSKYPQSRPDLESQSLPAPKRSILPALDEFHFKGVTEYLEDLVSGDPY